MNANPAVEYAVYDPASDEYVTDSGGSVAIWSTKRMAAEVATRFPGSEVHSRLNYAITPWVKP
jgi:hypothetical protein